MCSLIDAFHAGVPIILADELFESRINRIRKIIANDVIQIFNRAGILQPNVFYDPVMLEEFLYSSYRLLLNLIYIDNWQILGVRVQGLTRSKLSILAASVSIPEYIFTMIYPLLQPIVVGTAVYIPSPAALLGVSLTHENSLTVFGGRLGPYNELAERFGMYFRVNLLNNFESQFVGAKIALSSVEFDCYLTVWPIRFVPAEKLPVDEKYPNIVLHKNVARLPAYTGYKLKEPVRPMNCIREPTPQLEFLNAFVEMKDALPDVTYELTDTWFIPNCHMKLGRDSIPFQLALVSYIEVTTAVNMNAPSKRLMHLNLAEFSSLCAFEENIFCIHDLYHPMELFQSIFDMRCRYGRVDNPFGTQFHCVPTNINTFMATNWKNSVFPLLAESTVYEFPSPFAPDMQLYNGIFRVSLHAKILTSRPNKGSKAKTETITNTHQSVVKVADIASEELADITEKVNKNRNRRNRNKKGNQPQVSDSGSTPDSTVKDVT